MDPAFLLQLVAGDRAVAKEILRDFLASDAADRRALGAALDEGNAVEFRLHAHRIKGAARAIGADEYARLAGAAEESSPPDENAAPAFAALQTCADGLARWAETFG